MLINVPVAQKVIKVQHIRSHGLGLLHHVRGHGALKGRLQYPVHLSHRLREHARSEGGDINFIAFVHIARRSPARHYWHRNYKPPYKQRTNALCTVLVKFLQRVYLE